MKQIKKKYSTPECTAVSIRTSSFLAVSGQNTYGDDQGNIRFSQEEVDPEEAD